MFRSDNSYYALALLLGGIGVLRIDPADPVDRTCRARAQRSDCQLLLLVGLDRLCAGGQRSGRIAEIPAADRARAQCIHWRRIRRAARLAPPALTAEGLSFVCEKPGIGLAQAIRETGLRPPTHRRTGACESISLRGVPSGLLASKRSAASTPTARATSRSRARLIVTSSPTPTLMCSPPQ